MAAKECLKDYTAQKREAEDLELRVEELRQKRLRVIQRINQQAGKEPA